MSIYNYPTDVTQLINEISDIRETNIMDKIISYCEMNDYDIQEIGDLLSENETFKRHLWMDCVKNNTIADELLKDKQNSTFQLDEW